MYHSSQAQTMAGAVSSHLHLSIMFCLYFVVFLSICVPHATSLFFSFDFSKPGAYCGEKLNCTGDAYFSSRTIELTRNDRTEGSSNSSGRVWYAQPVQLWENVTGELASFATNFSFVIKPDNESFNPDGTANTGDGMAFFLGHYPSAVPVDSTGGNIGLFRGGDNMNATGNDRIVAVEFDTYWNRGWDRSGSHVGVDVNSIVSVAYANTTLPGKELTSGSVMTARINYDNSTEMLSVHLRIGSATYHVNTSVDLRRCLPEEVAIGFSAATGKSAEIHRILSWSFASTLNKSKTKTMAPVETPASVSSRPPASVRKAIIPSSAALFVLVCAVAGFLLWRRRTGKKVKETSESESDHEHDEAAEFESVVGPRRYRYCELAAVTSNFAEEEKLGQGGFGHVYRGRLRDQDRPVAIKVFSEESSRRGRKEFEAEVKIISRLRHRNLVQLLGWCDSRKGLLLVYELAPGGSLDKHIYSNERVLTWPERYKIILGLGSALCYLHVEWEQRIVHGDIKPSNILLDSLFNTKLGDFGLARLIDHGTGPRTTKVVAGTAGYIDPEFINTCRPSTESDVYSFGIVLLEIVSGRQPVQEQSDGFFVLLKWVWDLFSRNAVLDAVDERLRGELCDAQRQMERALAVGLWCAHPDRSTRPSIAQAMHVLQSMDVQLPVIPSRMYMTAPYLALDEGALSVRTSSGVHSTTSGDTIRSSDTLTSLGISEIPD